MEKVREWVNKQPNADILYVPYHEVIAKPKEQAQRINEFLGTILNVEDMIRAVDKKLYRTKGKRQKVDQ